MEKENVASLIRESVLTQNEAREKIKKRFEAAAGVETPLSKEGAEGILKKIYKEAEALTLPFGKTVAAIMKAQGLTRIYRGKERLDVARAAELTELNPNTFYTMYKSDCVVDMSLVISMAIGFKLGPVLTDRLLQSAGLAFRLDNPDHLAYMFLLEYCADLSISECNEILNSLGFTHKTRLLGSYTRSEGGYNKREKV